MSGGAGSGAATRVAPTSKAVTAFGGVSRGEAMGRVAAARYARREWFRSKFKIHFVNSIFLLLHGLKLKTLEYQTCSKFRDLQLSF